MNASAISHKITALRNQKGMTQKELAELCHVDIRTIQRIESGEVKPRQHTLKMLSTILGYNLNSLNTNSIPPERVSVKGTKSSIIAALIFSINGIPVVIDLITHSLNPTAHVIVVAIHISSCIFFYRGFYQLGKICKNQAMEISFLLLMITLPLINILELLKPWYFNLQTTSIVFILLCVSVIVSGISILGEAYKHNRQQGKRNYYTPAGLGTVIQGAMFLSTDVNIVSAGLVLSLFTNIFMIMVLYSTLNVVKENSRQAPPDQAFA